jgi:phosphoribosylglycinamide formyltransferase-1
MKNIAVFISGSGSNLQALLDAEHAGQFAGAGKLALVVSSNETAGGLERAKSAGVKTAVFGKNGKTPEERDAAILRELKKEKIDYIVLAGYTAFLTPVLTDAYKNKIINIHPSLIPSFCGKGYYGLKVHEAALASGAKETGATVHFVDGEYDRGKIIRQIAVPVRPDDTAETLQKRVLETEHTLLPEALGELLRGEWR